MFLSLALPEKVSSQIIPDHTLLNNSIVTPNNNRFTIEGGTTSGNNLFHSFGEFSLPTGGEAFFNNGLDIQNIITRVTGNKISNIDGLISANGTANLLLINPNGLRFGPNARLNIGGSFLGSTADAIQLSDGSFYSAVNPQASPLLTVNVPVGLQLGANPNEIRVEGNGHGFTVQDIRTTPINRIQANQGLEVKPRNTLALIGGDVNLIGGVLRAAEGQVALGSISSGLVSLTPTDVGWQLSYEGVKDFRNINLSQQAALDASGLGRGYIQMVGQIITLADGSIALIQNQSSEPAGILTVNASELLQVTGTNAAANFPSIIATQTLKNGLGGDIDISTRRLLASNGGAVDSKTFGSGNGGNVAINAFESVDVSSFARSNPNIYSSLVAVTVGMGNAGNLTISTQSLTAVDGGTITTSTLNAGRGGNITIDASQSITMSGIIAETLIPTAVASAAFNTGESGTITINTSKLIIRDGADISTSTLAQGVAGSVKINASDFVEVSGKGEGLGGELFSGIRSQGLIFPEIIRQVFGLPDRPSGNSGTVTINTPRLTIADGARVSVANQGTGIAGNLNINANSIILLDTAGGITAATASGEGGNINLTTDFLQLRRASQISTQASGTGNGGNITLNVNTLALLEDSQVNANAFEGAGGNIQINTQGIFSSPDSQITASSQLGVSGTININAPEVNTAAALVELPQKPLDPSQQVIAACARQGENTFTATGRGGLIEDPTTPFSSEDIWQDMTNYSSQLSPIRRTSSSQQLKIKDRPPLVEATSMRVNQKGQVELVSTIPHGQSNYRENVVLACK